MSNTGRRGEYRDDWFVDKSLEVKEYLVKADPVSSGLDSSCQDPPMGNLLCYTHHTQQISNAAVVTDSKAILKCIISRKQKACSCTSSTTGAAYTASDVWRAYGRALHALCLAGSPMG